MPQKEMQPGGAQNGGRPVTPERILGMAWGYAPPLILESAVETGVFDALVDRPLTLEELASRTGASSRGLRAICNALVSLDFLRKEGAAYGLTEESRRFLVSTSPTFFGGLYRHISRQLLPVWLDLGQAVRSGAPARAVEDQSESAAFFVEFVESLFPLSYPSTQALADELHLAGREGEVRVLDVAAGSGVWGIGLAHAAPGVRITAVDWPEVLEVTKRVAEQKGVADRLETVAGDIRSVDWGSGYQIATLGHILHSEGPDAARHLIRRVAGSLAPGGVIAIAEWIPNADRTGPPPALIFAVNMLLNTSEGDTFTFDEMSGWLMEAGFINPRLVDSPSVSPLLLAEMPAG